jgi:quinol monooxygenase YgiN
MVYVPLDHGSTDSGEFLILDIWNNMDGLNQFFANPHVQEQAGQIFSQRDPVVWTPAEGFYSYHIPTPYGKNDRIVAVVRGTVKSRDEAMAVHNEIVGSNVNAARKAGDISHEAYFRLAPPGSPEPLEFLAIDVWMDAAGMGQYYEQPGFMSSLSKLFAAEPMTSVWTHATGNWVEW